MDAERGDELAEDFAADRAQHPEDMTDDERRDARVRTVRKVSDLLLDAQNLVRSADFLLKRNAEPAFLSLAIERLHRAMMDLDRVLELDGEP